MKGLKIGKAGIFIGAIFFLLLISCNPAKAVVKHTASPAQTAKKDRVMNVKQLHHQRMELFQQVGMITGIPWELLAAVDQYEYTMHQWKKRKSPEPQSLVSIQFPETRWAGMFNPDHHDKNPKTIRLFNGVGQDGSGDGWADENDPLDRLAAMAAIMLKRGTDTESIRLSLWDYYQNSRSVQRIEQFAKIYETFGTMQLDERAFPLKLSKNLSYRGTWGARRGWGGRRIHEGTDLFTYYGTPVRSTCYGIIEVKGWNPYGGWRIGIRDLSNVYHYYAHLSRYSKDLQIGDIVKPGQVIGFVGSSGYGKPGTAGKFPAHLHYGMYRDRGLADSSFDPYPYLKKWERDERRKQR